MENYKEKIKELYPYMDIDYIQLSETDAKNICENNWDEEDVEEFFNINEALKFKPGKEGF
mgnify:CR=1 FL=1